MKDADNIREAAKLSPDFMGFIFYPKSKRFVGDDFKMPELSPEIKKVGVFVNETFEHILKMVNKHHLDLVQLHGDESVELCEKLSKKVKVIRAFGVDENFQFSVLKEFEDSCEYFLFDTKTNEHGGSGKKFNWEVLRKYKGAKEYFLSGGIDVGDVGKINFHPFALDVNSKFEIEPGLKDINKLKSLKDELPGK